MENNRRKGLFRVEDCDRIDSSFIVIEDQFSLPKLRIHNLVTLISKFVIKQLVPANPWDKKSCQVMQNKIKISISSQA